MMCGHCTLIFELLIWHQICIQNKVFIIFIVHSHYSIFRVVVIALHDPNKVGQWKGLVGSHFLVWK